MSGNCDTDEILKQLQVLDSLRVLRENMKFPFFTEHFPELVGLDSKINSAIEKQEAESAAWSAPGVSDVENDLVVIGASEVYGLPTI